MTDGAASKAVFLASYGVLGLRTMDRRHLRDSPARPVVLIIDGHHDTRALYALGLSVMGFDVVAAQDETDGCRRAREIQPDIIVLNLLTSYDDGWQFVEAVTQNPRIRDIPVVAVSGHVQRSVPERAHGRGFAAFFLKPCLPEDLAAGLRQVLQATTHAAAGADGTRRNLTDLTRRSFVPCPKR